MSIFTEIDRRLRHSMAARAQPFIRANAPWLHQALIVARDVLLPYNSRFGLSRYQHRAIERFMAFKPDLSGRVLEIGSDIDGNALKELASRGARRLVGLNIDVDPSAHGDRKQMGAPTYEIVQADVRHLPFEDESISAILSITAFEHVQDFDIALREMYRVLAPGGIVYSDFGPIWSCSIGHHVYAIADGLEARHFKPGKNPVPHFAHLLMTREELRSAVLQHSWVTANLANEIVKWVYESPGINRLFYEDYIGLFSKSSFTIRHIEPVREHVPRDIRAKLAGRHKNYADFDVRMVEVLLEKDVSKSTIRGPRHPK